MAVLLTPPYLQFFDDNGNPLSGGKVYTYAAGTLTPKATYTDASETTPLSNPVILDSAGRATIWISGSYYIDVKTSADVAVKNTDNITAFNTSSSSINSLLPSQSGNAGKYLTTDGNNVSWGESSAVQTAPNARLTLTTGVPITTTDVTAATTLYYTPYQGNRITLYDGATFQLFTLSEISIAVPATTNQMYDVFVYSNSGTLTLELTAWTNDTTRATALTLQNGVLVKSGATERRYVGSVRTTSVSGQLEDSKKYRGVWNYYNRVGKSLRANDSTASWTYATPTWRAANSNTTLGVGRVGVVIGLAEDSVNATYKGAAASSGGAEGMMGIGINSTTTDSSTSSGVSGQANVSSSQADYYDFLAIGFNYIQALEYATGATMTFYGVKNTAFRAGLSGKVNC